MAAVLLGGCADPQLARFEATLSAHDSATVALERWCAAEGIAHGAPILAAPVKGSDAPPPDGLRAMLEVGADEPFGYRHVALSCGRTVLSDAHNWFVPSRLTPEMNAELAATDHPFGKVAAALGFRRERLESLHGGIAGCPANTVLSQRAVLRLPDGRPLALLVECYTAANLGPATGG